MSCHSSTYSTNGDDAVSFKLVILYTFVLVIKIMLKLVYYAKHALYMIWSFNMFASPRMLDVNA